MSAGLYIHIPFCIRKCPYCDFYSVTDLAQVPAFVEALIAEMTMRGEPERAVDTIYVGGGTPTVLDPRALDRIIAAARRAFAVTPDAEVTIEANPGTLAEGQLRALRTCGFNRINIGVQSFDDANLAFLGRIHSADDAKAALRMAEAAGFDNIGMDLIYALPDQPPTAWRQDLSTAVAFSPAHLSCYMLTCEPGTPMDADRIAGRFQPAPDARQAEFFLLARNYLTGHGYEHYEISNFARSRQYRSRHNTKYWNNAAYFGFGPAAHSYEPPVRSRNVESVAAYIAQVQKGELPVGETERLDRHQQMIEAIYLGLRQADGIDCRQFESRFGFDFKPFFAEPIRRFKAAGYLVEQGEHIRLTERGMLLQESIAEAFIEMV